MSRPPGMYRDRSKETPPDADGWRPGRWWRVTAPDGSLWCETSDEAEARESVRPGDRLEQEWRRAETQWRPA